MWDVAPLESLGFSLIGFGIISALSTSALAEQLTSMAAYVGLLAGAGGITLVAIGAFTRD